MQSRLGSDMDDGEALVGAWRLVSMQYRATDGQISYPLGTDAIGYLLYTAEGRFSAMISRVRRTEPVMNDSFDGTEENKARVTEEFGAYSGRYTVNGDHVVHHVELSLIPNWVGTDQHRFAELSKHRLILSASPQLLAGKQQVPRLIWERVEPSPKAD